MTEEPEQSPYYLAARFDGERSSGPAYSRAQSLIYHSEYDLSAYRFQLRGVWHVAVVGDAPDEELGQQLQAALSGGKSVDLDDQVLGFLARRGERERRRGPWTERHYRPGQGFNFER